MAYPVIPMSIRELLNKLTGNHLILPALQREFVWKPKDICRLFDSLMQEFPINTMMFWNTSNISGQPIAFYQFLSPDYTEGTTNTIFPKQNCSNGQLYDVVIDGQQRITSLLIGFSGTYKTPKAKAPSHLYLRLDQGLTNQDLKYDFQFLSPSKFQSNANNGEVWFKVSDILNPNFNVYGELGKLGIMNKEYAQVTLNKLANLIDNNNVLNYYKIAGSNIDDVLEIFVRTNSGGYTLKKGDLLMSALTVNWANAGYALNARDYVEDIVDDVEKIGYKIDKDWVFNAFLMFFNAPLSLKVSSFMTGKIANDIYNNYCKIKECIRKAFDLVSAFHLLEKGLTTKLAVLPIAYYLYRLSLQHTAILSTNAMSAVYNDMRRFLFRAILKNLFEAGTTDTLSGIRSIIDSKATKNAFPYADIERQYVKLIVTNADADKLLETKKANAFPVLNIIYALGYDNRLCSSCPSAADYDVDHIHPRKVFEPSNLSTVAFSTTNDECIAKDGVTFDSIANLELLDAATNRSKNKQALSTWLSGATPAKQITLPKDHFFDGLPVDIADFGTFTTERANLLKKVLTYL